MILLRVTLQEAVCSVVLKTLSQALNNGDTIECVIRETGINQDGRTTGITMPNHDPQEALIRAAYARAGLNINNTQQRCQFSEAHGLGGTNAHAIVEEHLGPDQSTPIAEAVVEAETSCLPLVLSSKSKKLMESTLESMIQFVDTRQFSLQNLACTLLEERSVLPLRRVIVGNNEETVRLALEAAIEDGEVWVDFSTDTKGKPQVLGIFTGQGAQWPGMLKKLMLGITYTARIIEELDQVLRTLPEKYRPSWTLQDQLIILEGEASNVRQASFLRPLFCAVQIVLVRLLSAAGIQFNAVAGHSSGEIARAFAAGFISAAQAIRIAYLHGVVSAEQASSTSGQSGAMSAAGMSYNDAKELCGMEAFEGRVCVAASNSPESVTISGDADAIQHVQGVLEINSTFARLLKVDKAYHSHHMLPCVVPEADDMAAFARGLGYLLERFGVPTINASGFAKELSPQRPFQSLVKVLLLYPWDHSRRYWTESRSTREHLRGQHPYLLFSKLYFTISTFQWKNIVRPRDLEWLDGHAPQGQTVFPAAGYIVMAMEAAIRVANDNNYEVELLEIVDMDISKAVVFEDDNSLVELGLSASVTGEPGQDGIITLEFFINMCLSKESELWTSAKGEIIIAVADKSSLPAGDDESVLLAPEEEHPQTNRVNIDPFYKGLDLVGISLVLSLCLAAAESGADELAFNTTNTYDKGDFLSGDITVFGAEKKTLLQV
ncbi:Beta-ketoacyl synthase domain-containing protein [Colletotrichum sp. SAR 10_75]|nr:Beta-ketoacyl synthase domain-containing protein [Colletotrichum sp. SAR 10_75]